MAVILIPLVKIRPSQPIVTPIKFLKTPLRPLKNIGCKLATLQVVLDGDQPS